MINIPGTSKLDLFDQSVRPMHFIESCLLSLKLKILRASVEHKQIFVIKVVGISILLILVWLNWTPVFDFYNFVAAEQNRPVWLCLSNSYSSIIYG